MRIILYDERTGETKKTLLAETASQMRITKNKIDNTAKIEIGNYIINDIKMDGYTKIIID